MKTRREDIVLLHLFFWGTFMMSILAYHVIHCYFFSSTMLKQQQQKKIGGKLALLWDTRSKNNDHLKYYFL